MVVGEDQLTGNASHKNMVFDGEPRYPGLPRLGERGLGTRLYFVGSH